jgi:hypothetical protein
MLLETSSKRSNKYQKQKNNMGAFIGLLSFIALIFMLVGLIKPAWLKLATRGKVFKWYGGAFLLLFIVGMGITLIWPTAAQPPATSPTPVAQVPTQSASSTATTTTAQQTVTPTPTKTTPAPTPKPTPVATLTPQPTPAPVPAQPQTVMNLSGTGTKSTQTFTVNNSWQMQWSYNCSNFGDQGNFQVFIYTSDGSMSFDNEGVNEEGMSGSDTEYYHTGGTYYLEVNSECSWNITVQD